jgi:hypothetical protein
LFIRNLWGLNWGAEQILGIIAIFQGRKTASF